jgi:hypothetical protein
VKSMHSSRARTTRKRARNREFPFLLKQLCARVKRETKIKYELNMRKCLVEEIGMKRKKGTIRGSVVFIQEGTTEGGGFIGNESFTRTSTQMTKKDEKY